MKQRIFLTIIGVALVATAGTSMAAGTHPRVQAIPSGQVSPLPSPSTSASAMAR